MFASFLHLPLPHESSWKDKFASTEVESTNCTHCSQSSPSPLVSSPQSSVDIETPRLPALLVAEPSCENISLFNPFGLALLPPSEEDDQMWDHLLDTRLFEDFDTDIALAEVGHFPWPPNNKKPTTAWWSAPGTRSMRSIWEKYADSPPWWDRFEPYLQEDENDFDPTLQGPECPLLIDPETDGTSHLIHSNVFCADEVDQEREYGRLPSQQDSESTGSHGHGKKKQICRHFLAGECFRKDCKFIHDIQVKICKFWLQGSCLKGSLCEYPHGLAMQAGAVADKTDSSTHQNNNSTSSNRSEMNVAPVTPDGSPYPAGRYRRRQKGKKDGKTKKTSKANHASPVVPITLNDQEEFPSLTPVSKSHSSSPSQFSFATVDGVSQRKFADVAKTRKRSAAAPQKALDHLLQRPVHISWLESDSAECLKQKKKVQVLNDCKLANSGCGAATDGRTNEKGRGKRRRSEEIKEKDRLANCDFFGQERTLSE
ncbi:hypothetical protein EC973_000116 [Apophysomyces ossiformis]|uniref:C3H1-type domain-containing protein n=1 Tax=Apophysomyces ossiformis TaxID=679940 RepID=A0A8H7BX24_9FUNG|nr:hypothetical protein EC973_000116 [Apophysomyces ossiformis]